MCHPVYFNDAEDNDPVQRFWDVGGGDSSWRNKTMHAATWWNPPIYTQPSHPHRHMRSPLSRLVAKRLFHTTHSPQQNHSLCRSFVLFASLMCFCARNVFIYLCYGSYTSSNIKYTVCCKKDLPQYITISAPKCDHMIYMCVCECWVLSVCECVAAQRWRHYYICIIQINRFVLGRRHHACIFCLCESPFHASLTRFIQLALRAI